MFQLDEEFLKELGVDQLPDDQKQAFIDHIYSQLEIRVGTRLSEGLSEGQLAEFESFVDVQDEALRDQKVMTWIDANTPNYQSDTAYQRLKQDAPSDTPESVILAEYASLKWLGKNRPDYKDVVQQVLGEIKQEIIENRDLILAA